jgi:hypothetical protein
VSASANAWIGDRRARSVRARLATAQHAQVVEHGLPGHPHSGDPSHHQEGDSACGQQEHRERQRHPQERAPQTPGSTGRVQPVRVGEAQHEHDQAHDNRGEPAERAGHADPAGVQAQFALGEADLIVQELREVFESKRYQITQ